MLRRVDGAASARTIAEAVRSGRVTATEVVAASLRRAHAVGDATNAFLSIVDERALARAAELDRRATEEGAASLGPLAGVPLVIKDNICVAGVRTTAGSRILEDFVPPYDATVVARLEAAGAVVIAKANLDEFGMGSTNENSGYGPVRHPLAPDRVAGGSSGGSAVAVAAHVAPLALGSDTGGSVRLPASFCGVVGFKPTYGALSRYGLIAYASSLDQVGVLARDTADVALALRVMAGADPRDATSFDVPLEPGDVGVPAGAGAPGAPADAEPLAGMRIGVVRELAGEGMQPDALGALGRARGRLEQLGAEVVDVTLPSVRYAVAAYYVVATAEASSNLARYDGMSYGIRLGGDETGQEAVMTKTRGKLLGREVRRRVLMGSFALSSGYYDAYYGRALKVRRKIADEMAVAYERVDLLLSPTATGVAYRAGEKLEDPIAMYVGDVATCLANLAGVPAVSVPMGDGAEGLPVGAQLMAAAGADARLLAVAAALQQAAT